MEEKDFAALGDAALQINSLCIVAKNYTDTNCQDEKMLHIGLMIDLINEHAEHIISLLRDKNIIP